MREFSKVERILFILSLIFGFSTLFNTNSPYSQDSSSGYLEIDNEQRLKRAGYWEIGPIYIDDDNPAYNWSITAATYDWCRGSGTWNDPYIIENVTIDGGYSESGISISNSNVFFIIRNCTVYNSGGDSGEGGIVLNNVNNGTLDSNDYSNNYDGIYLYECDNNTISGNIANNNNRFGIYLAYSDNNTISRNIGSFGNYDGMFLYRSCEYNIISENNFSYNDHGGIEVEFGSENNIFSGNICSNNNEGIFLIGDFNTVTGNTFSFNSYGIRLWADHNIISENNCSTNSYGISTHGISTSNLIFKNNFTNNNIHALDEGYGNQWDNGSIGNLWDNYTGVDADDNGIGDSPYTYIFGSAGSQDNYPIWRDNDDIAPQITINTPNYYDLIGKKSPTFDLKITEQTLNSTWYRLWNGTKITNNNTFEYLIDKEIEQIIWNEVGNGTVTMTFFANDSIGRISYKNVTVRKDILNPIITIHQPIEGDLFGLKSPSADEFNITFEDPNNIDYKWYMLSNQTYNTDNHTWNGYIEQQYWDEVFNGTIKINIFANDSVGNVGFAEISVEKDIHVPEILIKYPVINQVFGLNAPNFIVEIRDTHLATMWYTLNGGKNINFTVNGTLDPTEWNTLIDGPVIIIFYANNSLGNIHYESVDIIKETNSPIINITYPNIDQVYGYIAPNFNITITDQTPINTTWYTIDNGVTNYTFSGLTGFINQSAWEQEEDEVVTIIFYVNDSAENLGFKDINVVKDTTAPKITINSPDPNQLYGSVAPSFSLTIIEPNPLEKRYSLNGRPNITFTTEIQFSQSEWNNIGNGTVIIMFYIIDLAGNVNSSEIVIRKDIYVPEVTIISPIEDNLFANIAPFFTVDIQDANLDKMWYTLNFGTQEVPFTSNDTIDQGLWDTLPDGTVTLTFYANDTAGNVNFTSVNIIKDTLLPEILIISPNLNDIFGINPPTFELSINESNLVSTWYTIDGGITNYTFSGLTGMLNQTAWNSKDSGLITIRFYANDSSGNLGFKEVQISKDIVNPVINIYLPLEDGIFGNTPPDFDISVTEENLVSMWYTIDGGITNYTFSGTTGTFNQNAWDTALEGETTINFYAQDGAGNIGTETVIVIKRIPSQPSIPGYNIYLLYGIVFIGLIFTLKRKRNLEG